MCGVMELIVLKKIIIILIFVRNICGEASFPRQLPVLDLLLRVVASLTTVVASY